MKPRTSQLAQTGATPEQFIGWSGTHWLPVDLPIVYPQWWRDLLTADGGETLILLGQEPLENSLLVWKRVSGVEVLLDEGTDYSLVGLEVALDEALNADEQIRAYYTFAAVLSGSAALFGSAFDSGIPQGYGLSPYSI